MSPLRSTAGSTDLEVVEPLEDRRLVADTEVERCHRVRAGTRARLRAPALLEVTSEPSGMDPVVSGDELAEDTGWKVRTEAQREQQRGTDLFVAWWLSNPLGERRASRRGEVIRPPIARPRLPGPNEPGAL